MQAFNSTPIKLLLQRLSSLRITVTWLVLLFVLVGWGTLYQVDYGLYAAQERFFHSWIVWIWGVIPFPGGQLVCWGFAINLLAATILLKFRFHWRKSGIISIHYGLLLLLMGTFLTSMLAEESYLALYEGEASNVSHDYREWELVAWKEKQPALQNHTNPHPHPYPNTIKREIHAYAAAHLSVGVPVVFEALGLQIIPSVIHLHSFPASMKKNSSITPGDPNDHLIPITPPHDPAEYLMGLQAVYSMQEQNYKNQRKITLWGGAKEAYLIPQQQQQIIITTTNEHVYVELRRKRYVLPAVVELRSFQKKLYKGVNVPKSFESVVVVDDGEVQREARIFMNNPLRMGDYTFYQASYELSKDGREKSVLAVVKNKGRLLPYISSILISIGLLFHFSHRFLAGLIHRRKHHAGPSA